MQKERQPEASGAISCCSQGGIINLKARCWALATCPVFIIPLRLWVNRCEAYLLDLGHVAKYILQVWCWCLLFDDLAVRFVCSSWTTFFVSKTQETSFVLVGFKVLCSKFHDDLDKICRRCKKKQFSKMVNFFIYFFLNDQLCLAFKKKI